MKKALCILTIAILAILLTAGCTQQEPITKIVLVEGETYTMAGTNCSFTLVNSVNSIGVFGGTVIFAEVEFHGDGNSEWRKELQPKEDHVCGKIKIPPNYIRAGVAGFDIYINWTNSQFFN
jgi:hypothetical protein